MCGNLKGGNEAHGQVRKRLSTIPAYLLPLLRLLASSFPSAILPLLLLYVLSLSLSLSLYFAIVRCHLFSPFVQWVRSSRTRTQIFLRLTLFFSGEYILIVLHPPRPFSFSFLSSPILGPRSLASMFHIHDSRTPSVRKRTLIRVYHSLHVFSYSLSRIFFLLSPFLSRPLATCSQVWSYFLSCIFAKYRRYVRLREFIDFAMARVISSVRMIRLNSVPVISIIYIVYWDI